MNIKATVEFLFPLEQIASLRAKLKNHPVYQSITTLNELKLFMERHIYSVWDFMSLAKSVQHEIAPSGPPWTPSAPADIQRFINEIILEEETDSLQDQTGYISHYALYIQAMKEIGANTNTAESFVKKVRARGFDAGLQLEIPEASAKFIRQTYRFIRGKRPHEIAAAFALGREHIIPEMFRGLLAQMNIPEKDAPAFHYYLKRHIHLDQDHHGPMSMKTLIYLCKNDKKKLKEAESAAVIAIQARIQFWDDVLLDLKNEALTR